jgi:hypothetical protein
MFNAPFLRYGSCLHALIQVGTQIYKYHMIVVVGKQTLKGFGFWLMMGFENVITGS